MSRRERSLAQPEGRKRQKPGRAGGGEYYHIGVRRKEDFVTFRTQDVGDPGHIQRVAGKRGSGSWDTVKWLFSKHDAHREGAKLRSSLAGLRTGSSRDNPLLRSPGESRIDRESGHNDDSAELPKMLVKRKRC
jgi:hypothetical protein